jgi:hypothetical protein
MKHLNENLRGREASLTRVVEGAAFTWQTTVKGGRALAGALSRVLHLRDGGITTRWYTATVAYARFVVRLQRRGGWVFVVKYLKAASVLLQQSAGGQRIDATQALGAAVSRTAGSGIPRIIPAVMRKSIRSGDTGTIRVWLTFFGLYRVIEIPGKLKLSSIVDPTTMDPGFLKGWTAFLNKFIPVLFREIGEMNLATLWEKRRSLYENMGNANLSGSLIEIVTQLAAFWIPSKWEGVPYDLKPRLLALYKSGPNSGGVHQISWVTGSPGKKIPGKPGSTEMFGATNTSAIFTDANQLTEHHPVMGRILREWLDIVGDRAITRILTVANRVVPWVRHKVETEGYNPFKYPGFGRPKGLGKLGYKVEPAGKIRVFAMVDSLTQCVMSPVHTLLFSILKRIETDGTFNQQRPAQRLINLGYTKFWSLDLSSATDRFPLALQQAMMGAIIGPRLAELWARMLVERDYLTPRPPKGVEGPVADTPLRYGAGQPMGALTSWAAFSLCHHCLVQYAAFRAHGTIGFFKAYALLGDDIVLADAKVANVYIVLLLEIGVEYGLAKSLISSTGGFEFAKRTFSKGKDASAWSLLAIGSAKADHSVLESVLTRFGVNRSLWETLRVASKVLGYGYKAVARLPAVLKSRTRLQGLAILLSRPRSPWGLQVIDWLLQSSPGVRREVPLEVLQAIGERLFDSLKAKIENSLEAHRKGLETILNPDSTYGGNVDVWFDNDALHEHSWNVYVVVPLIGELKVELKELRAQLADLERPSLDDLNEIWLRIEELRDGIAAIPTVPNFFERKSLDFGGKKRSALIQTFRSVRNWLDLEIARKVTERCLPIKGMAMAVPEGPLVEATQEVVETPMTSDANQERDPEIPGLGATFTLMDPPNDGGLLVDMIDGPSGWVPRVRYRVRGVVFEENDIHLDGILYREDLPYSLATRLLEPQAKARVLKRLRDE